MEGDFDESLIVYKGVPPWFPLRSSFLGKFLDIRWISLCCLVDTLSFYFLWINIIDRYWVLVTIHCQKHSIKQTLSSSYQVQLAYHLHSCPL